MGRNKTASKKKKKIDREGKGNPHKKKSSKDTDEEAGKHEERDNKGRKIM